MPPPDHLDLSLQFDAASLAPFAERLRARGHVRLEPAFTAAAADALHRHLAEEVEWWRVVNQGEKTWDLGPESIAALDGEAGADFTRSIHASARDGFQFLYDSVRVSDDRGDRRARGLMVDRLLDRFNDLDMLQLFRHLTGNDRIALVDGQATRYLAGHFLTAHDDAIAGKNRIAAYVVNLTPRWRTEWGGLLQFHDARGDVSHALAPTFNAIHVFTVPQLHSVSYVTPFAGAPRYAVTGWFRSA